MASLGIVEALRHEAGLAFHAGGKKRHILVLALAFFNNGNFDRVATVGQEAFVLTLVNGYFRNVKFVRICDLNTLAWMGRSR